MSVKPKLVIVDTNCYVRLYCSPVRPILGSVVDGYRLMTLAELQWEAGSATGLTQRNPWLRSADIQQEPADALLKLREPKRRRSLMRHGSFASKAMPSCADIARPSAP
jgi:hypothetical protein